LIEKNIDQITCDVLGRLYFDLFHQLKAFRGTSGNFTGYGEYLVFCSVKSVLGGVWKGPSNEKITELERYQFTQGTKRLAQGYQYTLEKKYFVLDENGIKKGIEKMSQSLDISLNRTFLFGMEKLFSDIFQLKQGSNPISLKRKSTFSSTFSSITLTYT